MSLPTAATASTRTSAACMRAAASPACAAAAGSAAPRSRSAARTIVRAARPDRGGAAGAPVLTLSELRRASWLLDAALRGHRLQAIAQPDATSLVLTTWGTPPEGGEPHRSFLLLSCRSASARAALLETARESLPSPPAFAQRARALLLPSRVASVSLLDDDRQLSLAFDAPEGRCELLLQILPQRSNLYLLDAERRLLAALRPTAETRPELSLGEPWLPAVSRAPSEGKDRFADQPDQRFLFAIEGFFAESERTGERAERRRAIEQTLRREEKGLIRKL